MGSNMIFGRLKIKDEESYFEILVDYRQKMLLKTECRPMPAEYGSDFNDLI